MATKQYSPSLPLEIWTKINQNLGRDKFDPATMWTDYRQVCRTCRDAVELTFRDRHLPKTWISFDLGYEMTEDQGNIIMDTEFSFDRLSDDRKFAIFRGERVPGDFQKLQRECLREAMEGDNIEKPAHCVQIRRQVYDTEIPGIQLDLQALELTCDWRGMYSAFFAEEKRCNKMTNTWVGKQESWTNEVRAKAESGVDTSDYMLQAIDKFAHQFENNHRDARRARIRRQYLEKHNWQWDPNDIDKGQEKTILKRLQDKRFAAGMDEYSDDDEEADQDQSDEDVWEDEEDDSDHEEEEEDEEEDVAEDEEDEGHGEENVLHSV